MSGCHIDLILVSLTETLNGRLMRSWPFFPWPLNSWWLILHGASAFKSGNLGEFRLHRVEHSGSHSRKYKHFFYAIQSHPLSTTNVTQQDVELQGVHAHTRHMSLRSSCQQASAVRADNGNDRADAQTRLTDTTTPPHPQTQHTINEL